MKSSENSRELLLAVAAGTISGIRSVGGLRHLLAKNRFVRNLYWAEMVADQLPFIPPRTHPISMIGRAAAGAYAASSIARAPRDRLKLASIGAVAAASATLAITSLRKKAFKRGWIVSSMAGLAENGAVFLIGRGLKLSS